MNYAWEAVLLAEQNGRDRGSLRFVEAVTPSPYIEVSVTDLNTGEPEGDRVEINPLYRLGDVFGRLFDRNTDQMAQTRALFFDVCMHYIVQLDLREGLSREDYHRSQETLRQYVSPHTLLRQQRCPQNAALPRSV